MRQEDTWLPQPDLARIDIGTVLQSLADPVRLQMIRQLDALGEATCSELEMPVKISTVSHHMTQLRLAGLVSTRIVGTARPSRLRKAELEKRFPGLLRAVLRAAR
ncbi:ArsR/SmtB family transcription factor [Luteimonas aquatica]|uniref:ArsR/SmtB family transcription factor n=1 Tax=Luteimonas aquatica TaxID=450364 RepID=UPI001F58804C|nr:helix-turn-helix domain-containing protein [Luteimonas aquatica]